MSLENLLEKLDIDALKKLIENDTVYESKVLRAAFPGTEIMGMEAVDLYRIHFALFHKLYMLQNEYIKEGKYLHVHFMRTGVFNYPEDSCAFFNENTMSFCCQEIADGQSHCELHTEQLGDDKLESLSQKYFYLDTRNYDKLDSASAESLLSGAWEVLSSEYSLNDAYATLGLSGHENIKTIKIRFRELCKKYHPDHDGDRDKFMDINRSYRMITKWIKDSEIIS
ncbi:MAG: hypothetical protein C0602_12350 [Denitrovibrio sp.]|nr:MAG: hypothetical protein C0602_12350 [Denitrovibrio sp.]